MCRLTRSFALHAILFQAAVEAAIRFLKGDSVGSLEQRRQMALPPSISTVGKYCRSLWCALMRT